jgi:hypothetical protein
MLAGNLMEDAIDEAPEGFEGYENKNYELHGKFYWKIRSRLIQKEDME